MRLTHIIWKAKYIEKLAVKHGVAVTEVEDVFAATPFIRKVAKGHEKMNMCMPRMAKLLRGAILWYSISVR